MQKLQLLSNDYAKKYCITCIASYNYVSIKVAYFINYFSLKGKNIMMLETKNNL